MRAKYDWETIKRKYIEGIVNKDETIVYPTLRDLSAEYGMNISVIGITDSGQTIINMIEVSGKLAWALIYLMASGVVLIFGAIYAAVVIGPTMLCVLLYPLIFTAALGILFQLYSLLRK